MVASKPIDFRKGMDSLAALVMQALASDPFTGDIFYLPRQTIGSSEAAGLGRIRPVPGQQAPGERRLHVAAGA